MIVLGELLGQANFPSVELAELPTVRELRKRDKVRVLVNSYTPGLAVKDTNGGPIHGFEIDLARSLARSIFGNTADVDSHLEFVEAANSCKIRMLLEHQVDMIIANLTDTPERRKSIDFAGHYISMRFAPLLGPDIPDISRVEDFAGLTVGVEAGSLDEEILRGVAPHSEIIPMESTQDWIDTIDNGKIHAYWEDTVVDPWYARLSGSKIRQGSLRAGVGHSSVGINKDAEDLRRFINDFTAQTLASGQLTSSLYRWAL